MLLDTTDLVVLRLWKGYRDAECGWLVDDRCGCVCPVIYAPRRGALEVWHGRYPRRIARLSVGRQGHLVYCAGAMPPPPRQRDVPAWASAGIEATPVHLGPRCVFVRPSDSASPRAGPSTPSPTPTPTPTARGGALTPIAGIMAPTTPTLSVGEGGEPTAMVRRLAASPAVTPTSDACDSFLVRPGAALAAETDGGAREAARDRGDDDAASPDMPPLPSPLRDTVTGLRRRAVGGSGALVATADGGPAVVADTFAPDSRRASASESPASASARAAGIAATVATLPSFTVEVLELALTDAVGCARRVGPA